MKERVLITGSGGFLGYHLSKKLVSLEAYEVFGIDNFSRYPMDKLYEELIKDEDFNHLELDLNVPFTDQSLPKFDYVFHFAALNGTGNFYTQPFSVIKAGILPTINLLDFLTTSKPKKVIYAGTSESYAGAIELFDYIVPTPEEVPLVVSDVKNPRWSYAAAKTLSEVTVASVAQAEDFNFNIVRFHNVYGPRMGKSHVIPELMLRFKKNDFTIFGGENSRSFIYVDDAVDALILLLNDSKLINEIVNIGNEDLIRIYDLAILIQETLQIQGKIVDEGAPSGSPMLRCPNTKRLRSIGYKSKVELKEGLQKTLVFYEN
jgi:nucleoside-diphosphate-sugar epimerase